MPLARTHTRPQINPTVLGTTPTLLGTTPTLLGTNPTMIGRPPLHQPSPHGSLGMVTGDRMRSQLLRQTQSRCRARPLAESDHPPSGSVSEPRAHVHTQSGMG